MDALGHGVTSTGTALTVTHAVRTLALEGHPLETILRRTDQVLAPFDTSVSGHRPAGKARPRERRAETGQRQPPACPPHPP
ncbi:SpoIIE family protein phosphatase [Streptomyces sp. CB03234]|uniref:SpoIIE family protein phosphatase n=1 Tax=Streptomyces sp. (strain CB03234) TaxID=1703937 RepID=UPI003082B4E7